MSSMVELSFLQKSSDLKQDILLKLADYYRGDSSLYSKSESKRVFKLAQKGFSEFQERFNKEIPKKDFDVLDELYILESRTGRSFFFSVKTLDYIKSIIKQNKENTTPKIESDPKIIKV